MLYGSAIRCGRPDCPELLYKPSDAGGRIRNSEVAHIHAATPNGPRPLDPFDCEAVRHFDNLIVLCIPHANEIDQFPSEYPPDELRRWKAAQISEAEALGTGWDLEDSELEELFEQQTNDRPTSLIQAVTVAAASKLFQITALQQRKKSEDVSARWDQLHAESANRLLAWDDQGERLRARPSLADRQRLQTEMENSLKLSLLALEDPKRELSTSIAGLAAVLGGAAGPFVHELEAAVVDVTTAAGNWPSDLAGSLDSLASATDSLCSLARGESPEVPQPRPTPEALEPTAAERQLADLKAQIDSLRERSDPFLRVQTRDGDLQLAKDIADFAEQTTSVPETPYQLVEGLTVSAWVGRIPAVLRNSDLVEVRALLEHIRPMDLDIRAEIVRSFLSSVEDETALYNEMNAEFEQIANDAVELLAELDFWQGNRFQMPLLLAAIREFGAEDLSSVLTAVLSANPDIAAELVLAFASRFDSLDSETHAWLGVGSQVRPEGIPDDIPCETISTILKSSYPTLVPLGPPFDSKRVDDEDTRLLSEFLFFFGDQDEDSHE